MHFKYFVVLLTLVYNSDSKVTDKCATIPLIEHFDVQRMMGTWYPQEIASDKEILNKCVYYTLVSDAGKANVTITVKRISAGDKFSFFKMWQINDTSQFRIEWHGNMRTISLVGSDYKSWCTFYACFPEAPDKSLLDIGTRESKRDDAVVKKVQETLKKINLGGIQANMRTIDRSNC